MEEEFEGRKSNRNGKLMYMDKMDNNRVKMGKDFI